MSSVTVYVVVNKKGDYLKKSGTVYKPYTSCLHKAKTFGAECDAKRAITFLRNNYIFQQRWRRSRRGDPQLTVKPATLNFNS